MSVFVTGASGLLGLWLVRALVERGDRVVVLRRGAGEPRDGDVVAVQGDVLDAQAVDRALAEHDVDTVFHLAGLTQVGEARDSPAHTYDVNVRGTWQLLDACRARDVARVVVASSDKVYGPTDDLPYREDQPLAARFPYDVSKAAADMIARSYWETYGLPVAVTRFANVYGGGDLNFSRLIPGAATAALEGRRPVIRSDGTPERDYLYVSDAVAAYLLIAAALDDGGSARGQAYNGGAGRAWSVREIVEKVCAAAGTDVQPDIQGAGVPAAEIDREWVDTSKLRETLGWAPQVDLDEGLARTVEWYRTHPEVRP